MNTFRSMLKAFIVFSLLCWVLLCFYLLWTIVDTKKQLKYSIENEAITFEVLKHTNANLQAANKRIGMLEAEMQLDPFQFEMTKALKRRVCGGMYDTISDTNGSKLATGTKRITGDATLSQ